MLAGAVVVAEQPVVGAPQLVVVMVIVSVPLTLKVMNGVQVEKVVMAQSLVVVVADTVVPWPEHVDDGVQSTVVMVSDTVPDIETVFVSSQLVT